MAAYNAVIQIGVVGGAAVKQITTDIQTLAKGLDNLNTKLQSQTARIQSLGKSIRGSLSSAAIGGAFPLLFGQTPQAAVGGAIGGLLGGQAGGFAGSLLGTAIGELQATQTRVKELGVELGFSSSQANNLATAFDLAGRNSQQLEAAITNLKGIGLSINETSSAIKIAVELSKEYGGSVEKIAQAFADTLESGKVSIATLNKFTAQGIPIQDELAAKFKVSRTQLLEMAKSGKISVQQVTDALVSMGQQAENTTDKAATGFDRFSKSVTNIALAIGDAAGALLKNLVPALDTVLTKLAEIITQATKAIRLITDKNVGELSTAVFGSGFARGTLTANKGNIEAITKALGNLRPGIATNTEELKKIEIAAANAQVELARYGGQLGELSQKTAQVELSRVQQEILQRRKQLAKPEAPAGITGITAPANLAPSTKGVNAGETALKNSLKRTEALNAQAATLFLTATIQDKINDAERIGAKELALRLTYERDRAKILGDYAAQQAKLADTTNKAEESAALNKKRNSELVALQLDYESQIKTRTLERQALGYEMQTQLQQEAYLMQQTLAGKGEQARLELEIANAIKDLDPVKAKAVADQIRQNDALRQQLDLAAEMKQVYGQIGMAIKDGVVQSISAAIDGTKSLQEVATNMLNRISNMLLDIGMNLLLFGAPTGTGKGGGLFGGLFKAKGGPVMGGSPYVVGERGPELFVPGRSGTIVPNNKLGGGGSANVVVNVDATGSRVEGDSQQAKQLGDAIGVAIRQELIKQKRPGGLLS